VRQVNPIVVLAAKGTIIQFQQWPKLSPQPPDARAEAGSTYGRSINQKSACKRAWRAYTKKGVRQHHNGRRTSKRD
jgi:hypothetical protein